MKYIKSYILYAFMTLAFTGCKTDDLKDDLNDLKDRVALLEAQVKILNDNVQTIAYILNPENLAISDVKYNDDGTQFTITLSNGDELTLTVGKPGEINETPTIKVTEDGYWEINGVKSQYKAVGADGANGDGVPQFKVEDGAWKVSFDNGENWTHVEGGNIDGVTGNLGDQFFKSAQLTEDGKYFVITTLEDEIIKLPVTSLTCKIKVESDATQPISFAAGDIKDFEVQISGGEPLAPIYPAGWRAELTKRTEVDGDYNYTLTVYAPAASRATADNTSDISVRVTDGTSWAVDKITVTLTTNP